MTEDKRLERSIAEHVQWCREERAKLAADLAQFETGTKSIGTPGLGGATTQGSLTRIAYLRRNIEQLDRVILAYSI